MHPNFKLISILAKPPFRDSVMQMQEVFITQEHIELYKILKFEGLCSSGGEAKSAIAEGLVQVNGTVETQKRKKIVSGDTVLFNGTELQISTSSTES
ncbi:RNA-binding S4 domain-containing protein [Coraliomargarita sp. W4R53]